MRTLLKKLTLTLGCALLFVSANTVAADNDCDPCCDSCWGNWSFRGEWLYLRPCIDGVYAAIKIEESKESGPGPDTEVFSGKIKNFDFELESGFRLGLGYSNPDCYCWDVNLDWTYFSPSHDQKEKVETPGNTDEFIFPFFCLNVFSGSGTVDENTSTESEVKADWDLDSHLVDLTFSFPFCLNECFRFTPHFGLRYAHIDQELTSKSTFTSASETEIIRQRYDNEFDGVGPRGGFYLNWDLGCGFGLYGDLALTVAYGETDGGFRIKDDTFDSSGTRTKGTKEKGDNESCCSRVITDVGFGASWCTTFCECVETRVRLGWEHHVFFNQGVADNVTACVLITKEENSDLSTQGLVLGFGMDF